MRSVFITVGDEDGAVATEGHVRRAVEAIDDKQCTINLL